MKGNQISSKNVKTEINNFKFVFKIEYFKFAYIHFSNATVKPQTQITNNRERNQKKFLILFYNSIRN